MAANGNDIEKRLWAVADQLWANSGLRPSEFSTPVLGLIFLRYAEKRFAEIEDRIGPVGSGERAQDRQGGLPSRGGHLPAARGPLLAPPDIVRGREHRACHQRDHAGHRGREPRPPGCPAAQLQRDR